MRRKTTQKEFITQAIKVHGDKFGYEKVNYVNNHTKVKIYCKKCKRYFYQTPNGHLKGKGCKNCDINNRKTTQKEFITQAIKVHGDKFGYEKVNYVNNHTKVKIYCKKCKRYFYQTPNGHLKGKGCKNCDINNRKTTQKEFITQAIKVHGDKFGYEKVNYVNNHTKVKIYCKKCKKCFYQTPNSHLKGRGCPFCVHIITKPELEFLKYCKVPNKPSNRQVKIKRYNVDGIIRSKKEVFEFLGSIHHGDSRIYKRTDIHPIFKKTYGELYDYTIKRFNHLIELSGRDYIIRYVWGRDWDLYKKGLLSKPNIKIFKSGQKRI